MAIIELSADHKYTVDGINKPSVTQILKSVGLIEVEFYTDYGADRGSKIHKATSLHDQGLLDEEALDPVLKTYLDAWKAFRQNTGFEPKRIEDRFYSKAYGFCGTIDRWGIMDSVNVLVEIKSGPPEPWHAIQVAGYKLLLRENAITCNKCILVYLSESGYKIVSVSPYKNDALFLASVSILNFKLNGKNRGAQ